MHTITVFSAMGGNGIAAADARYRTAAIFFLWCFIFLMPAAAFAAQALNQPPAGGDSSGILPVSLGKPAGCFYTNAYALNSGSYPEELVVAGASYCGGEYQFPFQWRAGAWTPLELPEGNVVGGQATGVDDNLEAPPSITYQLYEAGGGNYAYVLSEDAVPMKLELLPDMIGSEMTRLTAEGGHVIGDNWNGDWDAGYNYRAVRWSRDGESWSAPEELASGRAVAASEDGSIVVGNGEVWEWFKDAQPWVWTSGPGEGELTFLESWAVVYDITHDGSMIVGSRPQPCSNPDSCDFLPAPVYWVIEEGAWVMHDLQALDGVDSIATSVAIVNGSAIIAGFGYTAQDGGILRPVVWMPEDSGGYGPPLRLESLGDNFDSWAETTDINRNGLVLGWSQPEPYSGDYLPVIWSLFEELPFQINGGITDAWYNPVTSGQGFSIIVWEKIHTIFLTWFTYETGRPDGAASAMLGDPGHRWLTAQGSYADDRAVLEITMAEGGVFDSALPAPERRHDGTITLEFSSCIAGTVSYDIPSIDRQGVVPIQRISSANVANCENPAAPAQ